MKTKKYLLLYYIVISSFYCNSQTYTRCDVSLYPWKGKTKYPISKSDFHLYVDYNVRFSEKKIMTKLNELIKTLEPIVKNDTIVKNIRVLWVLKMGSISDTLYLGKNGVIEFKSKYYCFNKELIDLSLVKMRNEQKLEYSFP